jgi:rhamnosyltransferase
MRSRNDMPLVEKTLAALRTQDLPLELVSFDNESTDGTTAAVRAQADRVHTVPAGTYVPGRVLNQAMAATAGEVVVFVNADCTPQDSQWLRALIAPFQDQRVAATFGRQIPRPGCWRLYARDTENTFGDGLQQRRWRHCFSMAASAVRRSVWAALPFREDLTYSEDIDWTWRVRQQGHTLQYVPEAVAMHSHNYTPAQLYRRQYGEGRAEAAIFAWTAWEASLLRYSLLPCARQLLGDWRYCLRRGALGAALAAPVLRLAQGAGRRRGFGVGRRERRQNSP